jgi:hypothetical protein
MTDEELQAIRERLANATPGPWEAFKDNDGGYNTEWLVTTADGYVAICDWGNGTLKSDAQFIAHAPTDIAALIAEVEKLKAKLKRLSTLPVVEAKGPNDTDAGRF